MARLRAHQHYLDWDIKPLPFKVYPRLQPIALPREFPSSSMPALAALAVRSVRGGDGPRIPDLSQLARLLHFSAGITHKKTYPGGEEYHFRAAACTGALYHIDVYVICGDLPELAAGVYHFGPHNFALHQLRAGDHRAVLVDASGGDASLPHAPIILACASTYWRNAWKYQARAYRHCFWDSGTLLANLLAIAAAEVIPASVMCGFADETVRALLGLDAEREGPLALVAIGHDPGSAPAPRSPVAPILLQTLPLSTQEVDYPAIREAQAASALAVDDVAAWRSGLLPDTQGPPPAGRVFPLRPLDAAALPGETIDHVIARRGSARQFPHAAISFAQLSTVLHCTTRGVVSDWGGSPNDLYLIVNAVDDLPPGTYVFHRDRQVLELLRAGDFRRDAGFLGLGQELPADASVNFYWLCDLEPVLSRLGNRGYRVAQLDAAIAGGKVYLAAYALGLGATGLTFFDDDVTAFFSPHAAGKSVMFLVAIGRRKRARPQMV